VNYFCPAANAKQKQYIPSWPALHFISIRSVVGNEAAADLGAIRTAYDDRVAPGELSLDPNNADRQQAVAAPQGGHRTSVDR